MLALFYYNDLDISLFIIIIVNYLLITLLHYLIFTDKKTSPFLFIIHHLKRGLIIN